ncbi:hypothetical protein VPEG_00054 [Vibrio phage SIO-2]|uniref:hypothetical protein n=1 Tax=Vibrio phage SIO-2 TaxID=700512 RepID=UPI0002357C5C|nr:hypothetical protein VPEG_00054 [Vibrio phage SIO-2]AET42205.1 hypothetical protein VPEG_00054 [Vibrio phage SIO-2]
MPRRIVLQDAIDCIEQAKRYIKVGSIFKATSFYGYELTYEVTGLFINGYDVNYSRNWVYPRFKPMIAYTLNGYPKTYPLSDFLRKSVGNGNLRRLVRA